MGKQQLLYKYPPNFQKSQKHRLANRIFKGVEKDPACPQCQCCDRKIGVEDPSISCCYDKNQLAFLGPGIPLLFAYIRNSILMLLTFALIFAGFCLYSNLDSSYCSFNSTNCEYNIFNTISFVNKLDKTDLLSIQNYILVSFVLVNVFLFQFFRYNFRQIEQECDDIINSASDYAIILRRLPENITKEDIQKMVYQRRVQLTEDERSKTQNLKIDHIVLSYSMSDYTIIKQQNLQNFKQLIDEGKQSQFQPKSFPKLTQTAKLGIVVFSHQGSKQFFLYKPSIFQKMIQFFCDPCTPLSNFNVKGQRISIERAPQPDDIVWQNSKISICGAIVRKSLFNILGFFVLALGGGAQYGLALLQNTVTDQTMKQLLSIALSLLITIFNFVILQFLIFSSHKQRNQTLTQFNTVLTVKISFFQFLNTGVFVVVANFFANVNHFSLTQSLPTDITVVMIMNAVTPNLSLWLMTYFELTGKIFRWLIKRDIMKATQMQANEAWLSPQAQIPFKYAYVLKTLWLTAFYAPLVPIVVPISIMGLGLNYMIQKHLYGFVYSVPNMLSSMVNDSAMELMEYFPLIMSLGEFVVYLYMKNYDVLVLPLNWSIPIYVSIAISGLNLLLPMDQLNKCFKLKNDDLVCPTYDKVQDKFQVTYEMTNPAYECKKKRKRDVFLFNHIFGGEGKNAALNLSHMFGVNETDRSMINDPLLKKNGNSSNTNNLMGSLMFNNEDISKSDQKNSTTVPSIQNSNLKTVQNSNTKTDQNSKQDDNPFTALMKLNAMNNSNNTNNVNPVNEGDIVNNNLQSTSNTAQINKNSINNVSDFQEQNGKVQNVVQNKNENGLNPSLISNQSGSHHKNQFKNMTKDLGLGFKNNIPKENNPIISGSNQNVNEINPQKISIQLNGNSSSIVQNANSNLNDQKINNSTFNQEMLNQNQNTSIMGNQPLQNQLNHKTGNSLNIYTQKPSSNNINNFNNGHILNGQPLNNSNAQIMVGNPHINQLSKSQNQNTNNIQSNIQMQPFTQNNQNNQNNQPIIQNIRSNSQSNTQPNTQSINQVNTQVNAQLNTQLNTQNQSLITLNNSSKMLNTSNVSQLSQKINQNPQLNNLIQSSDKINDPNSQNISITSNINQTNPSTNTNTLTAQQNKISLNTPSNSNNQNSESTTPKTKKNSQSPRSPSRKIKITPQEQLTFLNEFPHKLEENQVTLTSKQKFIQQGKKQFSYTNKKFNSKGAIFYQEPHDTQNSHFPHVQIHVPGLKPNQDQNQFYEQQLSKRRRSFGKDKKSQQQTYKGKLLNSNQSQPIDQFSTQEIYNPRFEQKKPVDFSKLYGPPGIPGEPGVVSRNIYTDSKTPPKTKDFSSYFK